MGFLHGVMSGNAEQENIFLYTELVAMCANNWNLRMQAIWRQLYRLTLCACC